VQDMKTAVIGKPDSLRGRVAGDENRRNRFGQEIVQTVDNLNSILSGTKPKIAKRNVGANAFCFQPRYQLLALDGCNHPGSPSRQQDAYSFQH